MQQQLPLLNAHKPRLTYIFILATQRVTNTFTLTKTQSLTHSGFFRTSSSILNFTADGVGESEQKRGAGVEFPASIIQVPDAVIGGQDFGEKSGVR